MCVAVVLRLKSPKTLKNYAPQASDFSDLFKATGVLNSVVLDLIENTCTKIVDAKME